MSAQEDRRMLFIRNRHRVSNETEAVTNEYQVVTDAHIVGHVELGPYSLRIWEITDKVPGEERLLCLRIRELPSWKDESWKGASRSGFFHGGGVASEIVALASLFLRRRLRLAAIVRMNDTPTMISVNRGWIDKEVVGGAANLQNLQEWFELVEKLNPCYHESFILAARLYQQALQLIEEKPDWAYLNLVSSIEALARHHNLTQEPLLAEWDEELAQLTAQVADQEIRQRIESKFLDNSRVAQKFVEFAALHVDDSLWNYPGRPGHGRVEPAQLRTLLKRVYAQRSRTLHRGEPFPPYACQPPLLGDEEIPGSLAIMVGEKKWEPKDYIPHVHFFERLVRNVLGTFLRRNSVQEE